MWHQALQSNIMLSVMQQDILWQTVEDEKAAFLRFYSAAKIRVWNPRPALELNLSRSGAGSWWKASTGSEQQEAEGGIWINNHNAHTHTVFLISNIHLCFSEDRRKQLHGTDTSSIMETWCNWPLCTLTGDWLIDPDVWYFPNQLVYVALKLVQLLTGTTCGSRFL